MDQPWKPVDFKLNPMYQIPTYSLQYTKYLGILGSPYL